MTNEGHNFQLVTQLIEGLIDDPRSLQLATASMPSRVNWRCKVGINDMGKLIGKQGCHLFALRAIVSLIGMKHGEDWRFRADDPDDGPRTERSRTPHNPNIDVMPAMHFLEHVLGACLSEVPVVGVGDDHEAAIAGEFHFTITPSTTEDRQKLVTPISVGLEELTPIAAIGTLYRAYGRQQGGSFTVDILRK